MPPGASLWDGREGHSNRFLFFGYFSTKSFR